MPTIRHVYNSVLSSREITPEGYLKAQAGLMRPGVLQFLGSDLGLDDNNLYGVYFPPEIIFNQQFEASAALKPVTIGHPEEWVTAGNYATYAVGHIGDDFSQSNNVSMTSILVTDPDAIKTVNEGTEETSIGYDVSVIQESGMIDGTRYQYRANQPPAVNHLGIVERGRAGPTVRIQNEGSTMTEDQIKELMSSPAFQTQVKAYAEEVLMAKNVAPPIEPPKADPPAAPPVAQVDEEKLSSSLWDKIKTHLANMKPAETPPADPPADPPPADPPPPEDPNDAIRKQAEARAMLMVNAQPFMPADADMATLTNEEILRKALGPTVEGKTDITEERMLGLLDAQVQTRKNAADYRSQFQNNQPPANDNPDNEPAVAHKEMVATLTNSWKEGRKNA